MTRRLEPGDVAPDFTLPDANNNPVSLSGYAGRRVVVYFYPAALTPGCTTQAVDFTGAIERFDDAGIAIVGISPDPPVQLAKFRDKFEVAFPLLSDADRSVLTAYGAYVKKNMYGKEIQGVIRSTFVVDVDAAGAATIVKAHYNVRASKHVDRLRLELGVDT